MTNSNQRRPVAAGPRLLVFWLILVGLSNSVVAHTTEVAYTFRRETSGGIAKALIDTKSGVIVQQTVLLERADCRFPKKLRRAAGGRLLITTTEQSKGPNIFLVTDSDDVNAKVRHITVSDVPDELRVIRHWALVTCEDDSISLLDLRNVTIKRRWKADKKLEPPGNAPQDINILPGGKRAIISFQKDGKNGKKRGSRLVVLTIPKLKLVADVRLPRNHPEAHLKGNLREQGPSPEVVVASTKHDRLITSMDLYGGVAITELSSVLENGAAKWQYVSTAADGSWGSAFPDRIALFGSFTFVCNAGEDGGVSLVDIVRGRVVWQRPAPPGLEKPVFVPELSRLYSVCSGKLKRRQENKIDKEFMPQRSVYEFDLSSAEKARTAPVKQYSLDQEVTKLALVRGGQTLLLLAMGQMDQPDLLATFDPATGEIRDRSPAVGTIARFESE